MVELVPTRTVLILKSADPVVDAVAIEVPPVVSSAIKVKIGAEAAGIVPFE